MIFGAMTSVYFIIGTPTAGRRNIVRDLIANGLAEKDKAVVLLAKSEAPDPADATLAALPNVTIQHWEWKPPEFPEVEGLADATVFFLADSRVSPIDQLEALKPWLVQHGAELARVFVTVDCQFAEKNPVLMPWFAASIHFADVVFLTKREGVANKWMSDFIKHFTDQHFPCHFVQVKSKGDLANPPLLLDPTPRRVSQYFEEEEPVYDIEGLETDDEDDEEDEGAIPPEPYFLRDLSGRREKELPDFLERLPPRA